MLDGLSLHLKNVKEATAMGNFISSVFQIFGIAGFASTMLVFLLVLRYNNRRFSRIELNLTKSNTKQSLQLDSMVESIQALASKNASPIISNAIDTEKEWNKVAIALREMSSAIKNIESKIIDLNMRVHVMEARLEERRPQTRPALLPMPVRRGRKPKVPL